MKKNDFAYCFKLTIPILFGYISIGIPFGLLVTQAGYPWYLAAIMCLTMYTGSGQYIAIGLFAANAPLKVIIVAQIMTAVRHIFYGLSLMTKFKQAGKWKPYLIFALTDETYALLTGTQPPAGMKPSTFYATISMLDESYWFIGSVIGAIAGSLIKYPLTGIDFALTALFAVILTEQILSSKDFVPPVIGLTTATAAIVLEKTGVIPQDNMLLVALVLGIAALMFAKRNQAEKTFSEKNELAEHADDLTNNSTDNITDNLTEAKK